MSNSRANGTPQACAACKYQRRKCAPDCLLAPYFPHDRPRQFLNAHKLFGVSNITKLIRNLDPPEKDQAVRTIIFQSDVRANDPVGGCYRIISELQQQIEYYKAELGLVLQQLAVCRASHQFQISLAYGQEDFSTLNCESIVNPTSYDRIQEMHEEEYFLHDNNNVLPLQDIVAWAMQDTASSSLHDKKTFVNECNDVKPIIHEIGGERLELKFDHEEETIQHSDEAISKDKGILKDEIATFISKDVNEKTTMPSIEESHQDHHDLKTILPFKNCNN
ncbi:LOB domain-containing protein 22-like [Actinidia eriantha]|uniref:LOB domain-containing protein 22-like n=1 Tax=Actinidia eriantha TaxID=165200 RepID=UPI002587A784|nr:LOB domain-containing protein 22-like [Actinidia eriantha]